MMLGTTNINIKKSFVLGYAALYIGGNNIPNYTVS